MKKVNVRIEGISPLLMHRFPYDEKPKAKMRNRKQTEDDVESYLYKNEKGKLAQPDTHIIGTMKRAGAKFRLPKGRATYMMMMGSGAVIVHPQMIEHEYQEWEIDTRPVVITDGRRKNRIVRRRPILKRWALSFQIEYDEEELYPEIINDILSYAGKRVGIGDFRPDVGGPFGRFIITQFEELK